MTSSTARYVTTEDGGRQNMFAAEPPIEVMNVNYWENAELTNGRLAMVGFNIAIFNYILTGTIIPGIF